MTKSPLISNKKIASTKRFQFVKMRFYEQKYVGPSDNEDGSEDEFVKVLVDPYRKEMSDDRKMKLRKQQIREELNEQEVNNNEM